MPRKNPPVAIFANPGQRRNPALSESIAWEEILRHVAEIKRAVPKKGLTETGLYRLGEIETIAREMLLQLGKGLHQNPGRDRGRIGGQVMSTRVYEIAYKHKGDGKDYKHEFGPGVRMISEADGVIRLEHENPSVKLWEDF